MRYPADHREKTRQRILEAAGRVFRRQGFQAAGVDAIMAEAGLTAGAFYAHFKSKDDLFACAFRHALEQDSLHDTVQKMASTPDPAAPAGTDAAQEKVRAMAARYLSLGHRQLIDRGCPLPPLLADLSRHDAETRQVFEELLGATATGLETQLPAASGAGDQPLALLALMVGGLTMARAVEDAATAERILAACRQLVDTMLPPAPASPAPPQSELNKVSRSNPGRKGNSKP